MEHFTRTNQILTGLLILLVGSVTGCSSSETSSAPAPSASPAVKVRADLLTMPPELSGKTAVEQGLSYIDVVNESQAESSSPQERHFRVKTGAIFSARGWAFDDKQKSSPPVWLVLSGKSDADRIFIPTTRSAGKDIADGFKYPWASMARFIALVEQANIPPGTYQASLVQTGPDMSIKTPFYSVKSISITVE